jgi:hypothetical protein
LEQLENAPDEMCQLSNGEETAFKLGHLHALVIVGLNQVVDREESGNGVPLAPGELLHLFPQSNADSLEEGCEQSVVFSRHDLSQQRDLVCGLVSEDENIHLVGSVRIKIRGEKLPCVRSAAKGAR